MIIVFEKDKKSIGQAVSLLKSLRSRPDMGLINYRTPVVSTEAGKFQVEHTLDLKPDGKIVIVEFGVYIKGRGKDNDSPGAVLITDKEHRKNCSKIIDELKEIRRTL